MQVSVAGLRRNIKNIAHNYTEPQKKVREATSNDPWGPSSTLMGEIADLTYNIEAFAQIMEMLWKRLNDHGKNWRHVYKSLVLLEYLIKTGSERVAQQCKENIFAIQTLKDFQYFEDNKDQGMNVREKAKQLVTLLTSEERLRNERARALKARERFAQTISGFGSSNDSNDTTPTSPVFGSSAFPPNGMPNGHRSSSRNHLDPELEQARPQTIGEEELQLQLALAMSKEEAEQEEKRRRSDELKLQMALSQSEQEFRSGTGKSPKEGSSALVDLLDVDLGGGAVGGLEAQGAVGGVSVGPDPWAPKKTESSLGLGSVADPWSSPNSAVTSPQQDPWGPGGAPGGAVADPWATSSSTKADPWANNGIPAQSPPEDEFDLISKRTEPSNSFNLDPLGPMLLQPSRSANSTPDNTNSSSDSRRKKDPLDFLGENSNLVNLDNLVPAKQQSALQVNPFGLQQPTVTTSLLSSSSQPVHNPFQIQNQNVKPTINELREKQLGMNINVGPGFTSSRPAAPANNPWSPVKTENPFLG